MMVDVASFGSFIPCYIVWYITESWLMVYITLIPDSETDASILRMMVHFTCRVSFVWLVKPAYCGDLNIQN